MPHADPRPFDQLKEKACETPQFSSSFCYFNFNFAGEQAELRASPNREKSFLET